MDTVNTAEYEDRSILLINNYKKAKEKNAIKYTISPTGVTVYNLMDSKIVDERFSFFTISIEFLNNIEEVAIYKQIQVFLKIVI